MNVTSPSPQLPRRPLQVLKKHASARKNLFGSTSPSPIDQLSRQNSPAPTGSASPSALNSGSQQSHHTHSYSPSILSTGSNSIFHPLEPRDQPGSRRSNSSSQSNSISLAQTPPGTWSVSGKLVRKKASGLFREAARSWGRSKSKEVLSFGLGVLIGASQDAQQAHSNPSPPLPPPPPPQPGPSASPSLNKSPLHSVLASSPQASHPESSTPSSVGTVGKGPKKRISFHGTKKVKGKDKENSKIKRRSEIGFGDWADTLNTAVASSSPISPLTPIAQSNDHSLPVISATSINHHPTTPAPPNSHPQAFSRHTMSSCQPLEVMTLPLRRKDRPVNSLRHLVGISSGDAEPASMPAASRVPRSTFPHAHRSPRSPRRTYNTRATATRAQSSQNQQSSRFSDSLAVGVQCPHTKPPLVTCKATRTGLDQYQQPEPLTSSPFKRSVSPINQFEDDFNVESPIASKSHGRRGSGSDRPDGRRGLTPPHLQSPTRSRVIDGSATVRLKSVSSARANLFGATPNQRGGLEPSSAASGTLVNHNIQASQATGLVFGPHASLNPHSPAVMPGLPRVRQRTDSDPEVGAADFTCPFSSPSRNSDGQVPIDGSGSPIAPSFPHRYGASSVKGCSSLSRRDLSSSSQHMSSSLNLQPGPSNNRRHPKSIRDRESSTERLAMPQMEGLGMTPRRRSFDESCEENDTDEKVTQGGSSKPSSSTSILSIGTPSFDLHKHVHAAPAGSFLKVSTPAFDGFGALPPPESPFPGPHKGKPLPSRTQVAASPNKLKRVLDGELVGSTSQLPHPRNRGSLHPPPSSRHSFRLKGDSMDSAGHPKRDSWGHRSIDASEDDDEENGIIGHHEHDLNNGSHESHGGTSCLSVPGLTDSSSLASSLASSNQSGNHPYHVRPPVDGAALASTTWDAESGREAKRRSLPTNVGRTAAHSFSHLPPLPFCPALTPSSAKHSLTQYASLRTLAQPADSSLREIDSSFQNVKPNASAFLSSGMISKKKAARERRRNSSASPLLPYARQNYNASRVSSGGNVSSICEGESIAVRSMREALGGPRVIAAALREDEAIRRSQEQSQSMSMNTTQQSSCPGQNSLGILTDSVKKPKMPNTPIKKPLVLHKAHHLHQNKPLVPSGLGKESCSYSSSIDGSPIANSPTSRTSYRIVDPDSPLPRFQGRLDASAPSMSPDESARNRSGSMHWGHAADGSPSIHTINAFNHSGSPSPAFDSLTRHSPVYRRRSSDGVMSHQSGSSKSHFSEEPGTPTKSPWLKRVKHAQIAAATSSTCQLMDPQVTPNRSGSRLYTSFTVSPMAEMETGRASGSMLVADTDSSGSPPHQRAEFRTRHTNTRVEDKQRRSKGQQLGCRLEREFDSVDPIASGEFGSVSKALKNGKLYAVKRSLRPAGGPKALRRQYEEVDVLRRLTQGTTRSEYIIQLHDAWLDCNRWYMQTDYCENGTLEQFLELIAGLQDRVDEERIWKITSELAQAVGFMHEAGILHLDIKPANIFVTAHGGLKVGDFGLARRWPRINPREVRECGVLDGRYRVYQHAPANGSVGSDAASIIPARFLRYEDINDTEERHMMRFKQCGRFVGFDLEREGDREYIAPEILSGRYGEEADVFSVGLIALEIGTNVILPDNGDEWRGLRSSDFSRMDLSHLSSELVLLIKRMMDKSPDRRVTTSELLRHPVLLKLKGLRDAGLVEEKKELAGSSTCRNGEPAGVLSGCLDDGGDTEMEDDGQDETEGPIEPTRPRPPSDSIWRTARGAVLPEAEGFLQFILTGQKTPSRPKKLDICGNEQLERDDEESVVGEKGKEAELVETQQGVQEPEAVVEEDQMDIDP